MNTTVKAVLAWCEQTSTILGIAGLAGEAAAVYQHQMTWQAAVPGAAAALIAIAMPGRTDVQKAAAQAATDAVGVIGSKGLGPSPLALGADLVTIAGMLHPDTPVVAVRQTVTPIAPAAAPPAPSLAQAAMVAATVLLALFLSSCGGQPAQSTIAAAVTAPVPAVVTTAATDVGAALAAYQAALGAAEQAEAANPAVQAKIAAVAAKAAPYIQAAKTATGQAATAPTLSALTAELLLDAAPYIVVKPAG
jgi:hypothetical protein